MCDSTYRQLEHSKSYTYEEDGLTVTRGKAWTAPGCHIGCDILLYTNEDGKLVKVEGDEECPYNNGRLCVRCLDIKEVTYNENRIIHPMIREVRISGDEHQAQGWPIEDVIEFGKMIKGTIDLLHIPAGDYHHSERYSMPSIYLPHGCNAYVAKALKEGGVKVPLVTVEAMSDQKDMKELLACGITDFIGIGRAMLPDQDLPKNSKG